MFKVPYQYKDVLPRSLNRRVKWNSRVKNSWHLKVFKKTMQEILGYHTRRNCIMHSPSEDQINLSKIFHNQVFCYHGYKRCDYLGKPEIYFINRDIFASFFVDRGYGYNLSIIRMKAFVNYLMSPEGFKKKCKYDSQYSLPFLTLY